MAPHLGMLQVERHLTRGAAGDCSNIKRDRLETYIQGTLEELVLCIICAIWVLVLSGSWMLLIWRCHTIHGPGDTKQEQGGSHPGDEL